MQERYYPENFTKYENFVRWIINRALSKSSDKIICESNFVKKDIVKFIGIDDAKIDIIQSPPPEVFLNFKFEENKFKKLEKNTIYQKTIYFILQIVGSIKII